MLIEWNKEKLYILKEVNAPIFFVKMLQNAGYNINSQELQNIINWVKYDIARKLEYSEEWVYALNIIMNKIINNSQTTKLKPFLQLVKK